MLRAILKVEIEFLCVLFSIYLFQSGKWDKEKVCMYNLRLGLSSSHWSLGDNNQKRVKESLMNNNYSKYLALPLKDKWHGKLEL